MSNINWRDWAFKLFWTAVAAVAGVGVQVATDLPSAWAPILILVAQAILSVARQQLGETPPTL